MSINSSKMLRSLRQKMLKGDLPGVAVKLPQKLGGQLLTVQLQELSDLDLTWKNLFKKRASTLHDRLFSMDGDQNQYILNDNRPYQKKSWIVANGIVSDFIDTFKVVKDVYHATITVDDPTDIAMTLRQRRKQPSYAESVASVEVSRNRKPRNSTRIGKAPAPRAATRNSDGPTESTVPSVNRVSNSSNIQYGPGPSHTYVLPGPSRNMFPTLSHNEAATSVSSVLDEDSEGSEIEFIGESPQPTRNPLFQTQKRATDNQTQHQQPKIKRVGESLIALHASSSANQSGRGKWKNANLNHSTDDAASVDSQDSQSDLVAAGIEIKDVKTNALKNLKKNVDNNTLLRVVKELKEYRSRGKWLQIINRVPVTAHLIQALLPDTIFP